LNKEKIINDNTGDFDELTKEIKNNPNLKIEALSLDKLIDAARKIKSPYEKCINQQGARDENN
jgi:hypothetical protein